MGGALGALEFEAPPVAAEIFLGDVLAEPFDYAPTGADSQGAGPFNGPTGLPLVGGGPLGGPPTRVVFCLLTNS